MDPQDTIRDLVIFLSIAVVSSWPTDLGCYNDPNAGDSFQIELHTELSWDDSAATIEMCIKECRYRGYRLAAVRDGHECYCGKNFTTEASSNTCTTECRGNNTQICGGPNAVNIYTVCRNGTFKGTFNLCDNVCHCLVNDPPCDQISGKCPRGEGQGVCEKGYYGPRCQQECGQCLGYCDDIDGHCPEGCRFGWKGYLCKEECDAKTYGFNCSQSCENCNGTCDSKTGVCKDGCEQGYIGERCECQKECTLKNDECQPDYEPVPVKEKCNENTLMIIIVVILGTMVAVLIVILVIVTIMLISKNGQIRASKSKKEATNPIYEDMGDQNGNRPLFKEEQPYATTSMGSFKRDAKECQKTSVPVPHERLRYSKEPTADRLPQPPIGNDLLEAQPYAITRMDMFVKPDEILEIPEKEENETPVSH